MNNSLRINLIILFLLSNHLLFGQEIRGQILDLKSNQPVELVNIYFKGEKSGTISNKEGLYNLNLSSVPSQNDTLKFSKVGFKTQKITYKNLQEDNFSVYLEMTIDTINEITVNSKKIKSSVRFTKLTSLKSGLFSFGSVLIKDSIYIIGGDLSTKNNSTLRAASNTNYINDPSFSDLNKELFRSDNTNFNDFSDKIYVYNIKNNTFNYSPISIESRANHAAINFNDIIYILGGKTMSKRKRYQYLCNTIDVINVNNNQKKTYKMNPHQAANFASALYGDYIVVMGGSIKENEDGTKVYSNKSHFLNVVTGDWFELTDMPTPKETKGVIINNKMYLIGGFNGQPLPTIESFDMISGVWKYEGILPTSMANPALTTMDSTIYIFDNSELVVFNTASGSYREYKINLPLSNSQIQYHQDNLYIIGGYIEDRFSTTPSSIIFKVDLNELNQTKSRYQKLEKTN